MRKSAYIVGWALVVLVTVLSVVPPTLRPDTGVGHGIEHLAIFAITGLAFGLAYERKFVLVLIGLVVFAGAIELAQLIVPGRHARWSDFVVDAAAACIGAALALVASRMLGIFLPAGSTSREPR
jgi:VanZ family protein